MSDAKRMLAQARTNLVLNQPFFGSLVLKLKLVPGGSKSMATDGETLYYDPAFIESLTGPELEGLLCHEVMHCANGHPWRRGDREAKKFNMACDYAINPIILDAGMQLPKDHIVDPQYKNMAAEVIYSRIILPPPSGNGAGQGQGDGESEGDGEGQGAPGDGTGEAQGSGTGEGEGSGTGEGEGENEVSGGVMDAPNPDTAAEQEADWKVATAQAAQAAKAQGKLPADLERLVGDILRPRVDWRAVLRRFVQQAAKSDYSWKMPATRYLASGLYLPSLRSESMPPMVIAVDTSGSIDDVTIRAFAAEINAIADEAKPERIYVVYCDAAIQRVDEFEQGELITIKPKGGGGTDFRPVFEYVNKEGIEPACVVYLTDMYGSFPESSDYPTLWASITRDVPETYQPKFGEIVYIEPEGA